METVQQKVQPTLLMLDIKDMHHTQIYHINKGKQMTYHIPTTVQLKKP